MEGKNMGKAIAEKIFVLGVDAMDPRLTKKFLAKGILPNTQKLLAAGAAREDLVLLGGHPTVTPPMWTTLSTGAYPITHGIATYYRKSSKGQEYQDYNLDSHLCKAEQLWNCFVEANKKTLVFFWPGCSWPPTSDSPLLHVVDGTQPGTVNMGVATVDSDTVLMANSQIKELTYQAKAASDIANIPCVETDLHVVETSFDVHDTIGTASLKRIILKDSDGQGMLSDQPFDVVMAPIKEASGWDNAPEGAKEVTMLFGHGMVRRVGLILPNNEGKYDRVAFYKNKHSKEPLYTLQVGQMESNIIDEVIHDDTKYMARRSGRLLNIAEDGSMLKIWFSGALDIANNTLWSPKSLYDTVTASAGYPPIETMLGGGDEQLLRDCMLAQWDVVADWQGKAIHALMEENNYDVVFSHFHSIDGCGHMMMKYLQGTSKLSAEVYENLLEEAYRVADRYIGNYLHLLDEGWTIFLVSDHGQVCPEYEPPKFGDGVSVRLLEELGYTKVLKDENGKELYEIDWANTKAINSDVNIFLNIKGRDSHTLPDGSVIDGIVDPADQYELEEQIITDLYGYKHPLTGKRCISVALRNKDAIHLGMGGPEYGDIIVLLAEGYNYDHADGLSTTYGYGDTSQSPLFIAAGVGIKKGITTSRIIRQADVAPTIAVLGGVRQPAQCEGAPIYQILEHDSIVLVGE